MEKSYFANNLDELLSYLSDAKVYAEKLKESIENINNWQPDLNELK